MVFPIKMAHAFLTLPFLHELHHSFPPAWRRPNPPPNLLFKAISGLFLSAYIAAKPEDGVKPFIYCTFVKFWLYFKSGPKWFEVLPERFAAGATGALRLRETISVCFKVFPAFKLYTASCNQGSENKAIKEIAWDSRVAIDTNQFQEGLSTQPAQYLIF